MTDMDAEDAVALVFAEEGVKISVTEDGVKLVNQRKEKIKSEKGLVEGEYDQRKDNKMKSEKGLVEGEDDRPEDEDNNRSNRIIDMVDVLKGSRHQRSLRFQNHMLCESGEIETIHMFTQSDHGPAALSSHWLAKESASANLSFSSFGEERDDDQDFADEESLKDNLGKYEEASEKKSSSLEEQKSFSVLELVDQEEEEEEKPATNNRSSPGGRPSMAGGRPTLEKQRSRRNLSQRNLNQNSRSRKESLKVKGDGPVLAKTIMSRASSDGAKLSKSTSNLLDLEEPPTNSLNYNKSSPSLDLREAEAEAHGKKPTIEKKEGAAGRRKKKGMRRQRSKSLNHLQHKIEPKTNGISKERIRGLRRGSMVTSAPRRCSSIGSDGSKRLHRSLMKDDEEGTTVNHRTRQPLRRSKTGGDEEGSRRSRRSLSRDIGKQKEGSRRLQRSTTRDDEQGVGPRQSLGSRSSLRRCNTSGAEEGSRRLQRSFTRDDDMGEGSRKLKRSNTRDDAKLEGTRRLQRSLTRDDDKNEGTRRDDGTKSTLRKSNTGSKPMRTKSMGGLESSLNQMRRSSTAGAGDARRLPQRCKSTSEKSRRAMRRCSTGVDLGKSDESDDSSQARRMRRTSSVEFGGAGARHSRVAGRDEISRRAMRRCSTDARDHDIDSFEPEKRSSTLQARPDNNAVPATERQKKILDGLKTLVKKTEAPEPNRGVVYDAGWAKAERQVNDGIATTEVPEPNPGVVYDAGWAKAECQVNDGITT